MSTARGQGPDAAGERYRIVTARGEFSLATTAVLRFDLNGWGPAEGTQRLIVDLGQLTNPDTSVLGVLSTAQARAERGGGWLRLVYTQPHVAQLLNLASLDIRLPCHATLADAIAGRTSAPPVP
ncbi:STAS domain-containing protein [Kitasatospora sp. NBC_00070]|uniref:STAS domain-containing protein n=1 Tax=Kitasatospora sp. NBC_00070 TaxID=2975962 RepID=UPI00325263FA